MIEILPDAAGCEYPCEIDYPLGADALFDGFDPALELPSSDGQPLETTWHAKQAPLLHDIIETAWKGRDFFSGGNNFFYFSPWQVRKNDFLGPDYYVVLDVDHAKSRKYWCNWQEGGRNPDFIMEFLSESTEARDRGVKKETYRKLGIPEYYIVDPETKVIEGWRLGSSGYIAMEARDGRFWSDRLQMEIGTWTGTYLGMETTWVRFFDRDSRLLPTDAEDRERVGQVETAAAEAKAEAERVKAEAERAKADAERAKADVALAAAASEKNRADELLRDLNALRAKLASPPTP